MKRIYSSARDKCTIVKRKGFEKLNDFEQLCFLFKNNDEDGIVKTEERLVKKVMEKYRNFKILVDTMENTGTARKNAILIVYGVEQGIEQGIELLNRGKKECC